MTPEDDGQMGEEAGALRRNVRRLRDAAGLSREQLAMRADVTSSTIFRIESDDDYAPRMSSVRGIAQALGCRVADLFTPRDAGDPSDQRPEPTAVDDQPEPNGDTEPEARAS